MLDTILGLGLSKTLTVFIVSMLPVAELRGALPLAINVFHMPWYYAFPIAVAGNILPVPFLLLLLGFVRKMAARLGPIGNALEWVLRKVRGRGRLVEKYGPIGLVLFVAVPIPVTGAWTGSIIAFLLGIRFRHSFICICLGVFLAGIIVTTLCMLGWIGAVIAGVGVGALIVVVLWTRSTKNTS